MKILSIPILSAVLVLLIGCYRPADVHHKMKQVDKDVFSYKPGSFWIFKDSLSGDTDSMVITSFVDTESLKQGTANEYSEYLKMQLTEVGGDNILWNLIISDGQQVFLGNDYNQQFLLKYPEESWRILRSHGCDSVVDVDSISSVYLTSWKAKANVYRSSIIHDSSRCGVKIDNHLFFSPDSGIVEIRRNDKVKRVWELQRCRIIR